MRVMQEAILNGKPQKALCANTTVFKDVNYTWGGKKIMLRTILNISHCT